MEVLVVGGAGEMGGWVVDFLTDRGFDVDVSDPEADPHSLPESVENVPLEDADSYDIVVVGVPIGVTVEVIEDVASVLTDGLLMDITSVKTQPVEAMVENASEDVEVLGTHPMFGPSVRSVRGQTVILVKPEGRTGELSRRVEGELRDSGANVQYATAEEHDEMMSVVQGLTHYAYIAVGGALERIDFEVDESRRFMSPVYEIMLDFVGRILHQNPYLYAEIQANQPVERVHDALLDSAEELARSVDEEDVEGFVDEMRDAARHYGDTRSAHRRSDKIIEANVSEYEELHESVGEERGLRHIYSGTVHVGVVERIEGRTVHLDKTHTTGTVELNTENVELLTSEELRGWKVENLPGRDRDVSVFLDSSVDEDSLEAVVEGAHEDVLDARVFDVYSGDPVPEGRKSFGVRLEILDDGNVEDAVDDVHERLEGIGGEIRG